MTTDEWRTSMTTWRPTVDKRLNEIQTQAAVDKVVNANIDTRLKNIEDTARWSLRILIGGALSAVVVFAMKGGFSI